MTKKLTLEDLRLAYAAAVRRKKASEAIQRKMVTLTTNQLKREIRQDRREERDRTR